MLGEQDRAAARSSVNSLRLREVEALRILPRAVDEPRQEQRRDVDEHQRLTRISLALKRCAATPGSPPTAMPPSAPATNIARQHPARPAVPRRQVQRDAAAGDRAERELAFGADVPDVRAKADREAERDQHQRRRLQQQLGRRRSASATGSMKNTREAAQPGPCRAPRTATMPITTVDREREQRRRARHRARRLRARFELKPHRDAPASLPRRCVASSPLIHRRSPRRSSRAVGCAGDSRPCAITAGGRRSRTARRAPRRRPARAQPASRSASSAWRICAAAPTSTPQVGCATISSFGCWRRSRGRR